MMWAQAGNELTVGGWIVMVASVGFVTTLLAWSVSRVMRESRAGKVHGTTDIEPRDVTGR